MADSEKQQQCLSMPRFKSLSACQRLVNILVVNFLISPIVLVYWTSTWELITTVLFLPHDVYKSIWISFAVAVIFVFAASCAQTLIHRLANAYGVVWWVACSRVYVYVMAFTSVNQWRCFWNGWDIYTSSTTKNGLVTFFGAYFTMCLLRCSSTILAPPCVIDVDLPASSFFAMTTYCNTKPGTIKHVLDSLFTASFIPFLNVTAWRGLWVIFDRNVSPHNQTTSGLHNLAIAYVLTGVMLLTRVEWLRLDSWTEPRHWIVRHLVEVVHTFVHIVITISFWRGIWVLLLEHVFCDEKLRYWIGHASSFALLTACFSSKSLLTTDCSRDGFNSNGEGIDLDIYYVTKLWRHQMQEERSVLDKNKETYIDVTQVGSTDSGEEEEKKPVLKDKLNDNPVRYGVMEK